jgi:hypothetical protein
MKMPMLKSKNKMKFSGFSTNQENKIKNIFSIISEDLLNKLFSEVVLDDALSENKGKFSSYGRYNKKTKQLKINPSVFNSEDFFSEDRKKRMSKLSHALFHEFGHAIDEIYNFSEDQEWLGLSGWEKNYKGRDKKRLVIPTDNGNIESSWYYNPDAQFPRWYASRSPADHWAEVVAFIMGDLSGRISNKNIKSFVEQKLAELKIENHD